MLCARASGQRENFYCEVAYGPLFGIADIKRLIHFLGRRGLEQRQDAADQVGYVAEAARLRPVAIDGERFSIERLYDEV